MTVVVLHPAAYRELVDAAHAAAPYEACGVISDWGHVYVLPNVAQEPRRRYDAEPAATYALMQSLFARGERVQGVWHSHPDGERELSPHDVSAATHPLQLLIALRATGAQVLAFDVSSGAAVELPLVVGSPQ